MANAVRKRTPGEAAAAVAREQGEAHRGVARRARAKAKSVEADLDTQVERVSRRVKKPETPGMLKKLLAAMCELVRGDPSAADACLAGARAAVDCGKRLNVLDGEAARADGSATQLDGMASVLEKQVPLPPHAGRR